MVPAKLRCINAANVSRLHFCHVCRSNATLRKNATTILTLHKGELNSAERKLGFDPRNLIWIIPAKGVMNDAN